MKKGYTKVVLCLPGLVKKGMLVHWLVAEAFIGPRPSGMDINHINGLKDDNRPENLEYITRQQNIRHKIDVLGKSRGENMHNAILTEDKVKEMRLLYATGEYTFDALGKIYKVDNTTANKVVLRKLWKHVA